ncbi:hypothetical protein GQ53DRAFT_747966 [Thozetella sp. PMI_491]|nr:hypothetical protein GQ53DRAFT_747966 [Thozetella sp. PMI_491]
MADTEQATQTYRGSCHCGAFIFEMEGPEIKKVSKCNCSICFRKGYNWTPPTGRLNIIKGESTLQEYKFGPKNTAHKFCSTCGTPVMGHNPTFPEGKNTMINVRCIQNLDYPKLEIGEYDGAALGDKYDPPKFTGSEPTVEVEGGKTYHGSCHCGGVQFAVKLPVLDHTYTGWIKQCDCSICHRNAYIWVYPKAEQVSLQGEDNLSYYAMGSKVWRKGFCKICGTQMLNRWTVFTDEELAALPEEYRQRRGPNELMPLNLRTFTDFDIKDLKDEQIEMSNGKTAWGPDYVNP